MGVATAEYVGANTTEAEVLPQTLEQFYELHAETARRAAQTAERRNGLLKADDIEQELWVHVMERLEHYLNKDRRTVAGYFRKVANQALAKERLDYMYFTRSYVYSPSDVRRILKTGAWSRLEEAPDIEGRVDIRNAHDNLPPAQKAAVFRHYGLKTPYADISKSEQRNVDRGIDSITHYLNTKARNYSKPLHKVTEEEGNDNNE